MNADYGHTIMPMCGNKPVTSHMVYDRPNMRKLRKWFRSRESTKIDQLEF